MTETAAAINLPILMDGLLTPALAEEVLASPAGDPFGERPVDAYYGPRARWLLTAVLASLGLERTDEIAILTTTGDTYVSICVSVPAFNFCRISRVVTPATKVVILVHEFGYAFPDLAAAAAGWRAAGLTIIEDCAHVVGLEADEIRPGAGKVGDFGDFALFSLSKVLPTSAGGLLRAVRPVVLPGMSAEETAQTAAGRQAAERFLPHAAWFAARRQRRHALLADILGRDHVVEPSAAAAPFYTYVKGDPQWRGAPAMAGVEFGATLRADCVLVPTNPLIPEQTFRRLAEARSAFLNANGPRRLENGQ